MSKCIQLKRTNPNASSFSVRRTGDEGKRKRPLKDARHLKDFAPGFRANFQWLQSMDTAAARHVAEIMDALTEKQVASVIRVMPDPHKDIGLNILSQFHYAPEIQITTFETLADALQSLVKEDGGTSG